MNYLFQEMDKIENSNFYRSFTGILLGAGIGYHLHLLAQLQHIGYVSVYFGGVMLYVAIVVWTLHSHHHIEAILKTYQEGVYKEEGE